jgi:hypothetical protein
MPDRPLQHQLRSQIRQDLRGSRVPLVCDHRWIVRARHRAVGPLIGRADRKPGQLSHPGDHVPRIRAQRPFASTARSRLACRREARRTPKGRRLAAAMPTLLPPAPHAPRSARPGQCERRVSSDSAALGFVRFFDLPRSVRRSPIAGGGGALAWGPATIRQPLAVNLVSGWSMWPWESVPATPEGAAGGAGKWGWPECDAAGVQVSCPGTVAALPCNGTPAHQGQVKGGPTSTAKFSR